MIYNNVNYYLILIFVIVLILVLLGIFICVLYNVNKKIEELFRDKIDFLECMLVYKMNELSFICEFLVKDFYDEMGNKLVSIFILL